VAVCAGTDCAKGGLANVAVCEAYGEHSEPCLAAHSHFDEHCGAVNDLGEGMKVTVAAAPAGSAAGSAKPAAKKVDPAAKKAADDAKKKVETLKKKEEEKKAEAKNAEKTAAKAKDKAKAAAAKPAATIKKGPAGPSLKDIMAPVLEKCNQTYEMAKLNCKKQVMKTYKSYKAATAKGAAKDAKADAEKKKLASQKQDAAKMKAEAEAKKAAAETAKAKAEAAAAAAKAKGSGAGSGKSAEIDRELGEAFINQPFEELVHSLQLD